MLKLRLIALSLVTAAAPGFAPAQGVAAKPVHLNIAAQPVDKALSTWANQTGYQVLIAIDRPPPVATTPVVNGMYTPEGALKVLLASTDLKYEFVNARTVSIRPANLRAASESETTQGTGSKPSGTPTPGDHTGPFVQAQRHPRGTEVVATARTAPQSLADSESTSGGGTTQEVIVTARKRTERLQDVPISIAVVGAEEIDSRGLVSAEDYLRSIPGVNQTTSGLGQSIVIRGIDTATEAQNGTSGTTVATYFGETPTTNTAGLSGSSSIDLKLVDIDRVEVLRGPQGTAFGSSSMGGAVRTIPSAPRLDRFEGKISAGYSLTSGTGSDNYRVQAVGNLPILTDRVALRVVGYRFYDSGFYHNLAGSDPAFQTAVVNRYGVAAYASDEENVGSAETTGARVAALYQATDNLQFTLSYASQKTETDGMALANSSSGAYDQTMLQVAPEHIARGEKAGLSDTNLQITNGTAEYNFSWASLLASFSHIKSGLVRVQTYQYLGLNLPVSYPGDGDHQENVGEVRLATALNGPWNFLAGVYAEDVKDHLLSEWAWYGDPATNPIFPGQSLFGVFDNSRGLKQKAAFGEVYWKLLSSVTLTGGVRAYKYDRSYLLDAGQGPFWPGGLYVTDQTSANGENFRANLSYKPKENTLLYADWSQGFRLGQLQAGVPPGRCDLNGDGIVDGSNITIDSTREVNSDNVDSFELGGKFELIDRRLTVDTAVFRMNWSDVPVLVRIANPGTPCPTASYVANAGTAVSEGIELQTTLQVFTPFRVNLGGSWIHATITKDVPALNATKGDRLPGSPQINANLGLQYDFRIGTSPASVRADSTYVGSFYGDLRESSATKSGDYLTVDLSARVTLQNLNVDIFARNVTNEDTFTFRGPTVLGGAAFGYRPRPRTIGLQLGYSF